MRYIEVVAVVAAGDAEVAADVLRSVTGGDVWIEAPFVQRDLESDAEADPGAPRTIHAYANDDRSGDPAADAGAACARAGIAVEISRRSVAEEDWAESWKEYFHVERFGDRIVIVPSWRSFEAGPRDVPIALDPGMAFGTGQHETTRMCIEALERRVRPGMAVLDVGCGSGILSLVAAKLRAREVVAVDVDPNCVRITVDNARLNAVDDVIDARVGGVGETWPFEAASDGRFDIVVANIIARVIIDIADSLVLALASGGALIVSGVIGDRETETAAALRAVGARIESVRAMGDWRCIEAVRL